MHDTVTRPPTAYQIIGGEPAVRRVVDRFYDLMDTDPAYAELRAMHAGDLDTVRDSLTGFLVAWLGGPREWFEQRPGVCMMSAHRGVSFTESSARQWADAMTRAIEAEVEDPLLRPRMAQALAGLALNMGGVGRR